MNPRNIMLLLCVTLHFEANTSIKPSLSSSQKKEIGMLIWQNECSKSYDRLVFWKTNEKFPSLGICHFIWYPTKNADHYVQTFPDLIAYFKKKNVPLPEWLATARYAPWKTKEEFDAAAQSKEVQELRELLSKTMDLQVEFLIERFQLAVPRMLKHVTASKRKMVQQTIDALLQTPQGTFALLDYLNFKGDGTDPKERYNGIGWGLLQVFEGMATNSTPVLFYPSQAQDERETKNFATGKKESVRPEPAKGLERIDIILKFITSAKTVLTNRVTNAPAHKAHEKEWLAGWINRINRYSENRFS